MNTRSLTHVYMLTTCTCVAIGYLSDYRWELTLNKTVDVCREKELKCEYFGSEPVVAVEEERKEEIESSMETGGVNRSESQRSTVTIASENPR